MSKSLALVNGDLSVGSRSLNVVSGQDKLIQDLTLWVREKLGTDPMTPTYGSILDGGIINGQEVTPFIGQIINPIISSQIGAEVMRLLTLYQQNQLEKMKTEAYQFKGKHTLTADEIIYSIDSIDVTNSGPVVIVRASFTTLTNVSLNLTLPITS